jgi:SAM-dependent methyltransferase
MRGKRRFQNLKGNVKSKLFGKGKYGEYWQELDLDYWQKMYDRNFLLHKDFKSYFEKIVPNIKSTLEIGCGIGIYPIQNSKMFSELEYFGLDISKPCIDYCKKNSKFTFIDDNFLTRNFSEDKKFDLIFSHGVITHVEDIDGFLRKCLKLTKNYLYISSGKGYHPEIINHNQIWSEPDSCYYNELSVKRLEKIMAEENIEKEQYRIRAQKSGSNEKGSGVQVIIEVSKNLKK